jgi:toxin ParE1/3/4
MKKSRITPRAGHDLVQIGCHTQQTWGFEQRNRDIGRLRRRIEWLARNPNLGTRRDEFRAGIISYPEGEHLIYYIIYPERIDIIGLPHRQMDIPAHFTIEDGNAP